MPTTNIYIYITPYERLAESLWLTSDNIICYHLIIFTVLDREQILLILAGEKPVLICCLSGSLWPAESDKASLQSPPCGNETHHTTCCLKMPSLSRQSLACFNEMYTLALQCVILLRFHPVEFHSFIFISRLWCFERRNLPPGRNSNLADILKQVLFQVTKRCTLFWTEFSLMKAYCIYI